MKFGLATLLAILIGLTAASADVVTLRDGSTREGKILRETDEAIVVEVASGSAKATVTVSRADIDHIEKKLTEQEKLEAEFAGKVKGLDKTDGDQVMALGKWCISKKLYDEAALLYREFGAKGDAQFARAQVALANMEYERGRFVQAKACLKALLDKNPKDLDAKLLADRISEDEKAQALRLLTDAIDLSSKGKTAASLEKLEAFHNHVSEEFQKTALEKVLFPGEMKFAEFVADVQLRVACPNCKEGARVCPACKGKADPDGAICKSCGGVLSVVCDRCGGTGVAKPEGVEDWEVAALARAIENRASAEAAEFLLQAATLSANPPKEQLAALAFKAELSADRAMGWYSMLQALADKTKSVTVRDSRPDRDAVQKQWVALAQKLGEAFDKQGRVAWDKVRETATGPLAQEKAVRAVRDDLVRGLVYYGKTRLREKDPYPAAIARDVDSLKPLAEQVAQVVEKNAKILKAFDLALKQAYAKKAASALDIFVQIVKASSKQDLVYLSQLMTQKTNTGLADAMAALRFEVGREKADFGETTEYERPAFMKYLLAQADAMAAQAENGYQNMTTYSGTGKRNSAPTGLVHDTRENADHAKKWYKASLTIPYPLATDKRKAVSDQIAEMNRIIDNCARWYIGGGNATGGTNIGIN